MDRKSNQYKRYLVISNVCKKNNIKSLVHAAVAYNFEVIIVGFSNLVELHISSDIELIKMDSLNELHQYLQMERIPLVGIELMESAQSVNDMEFSLSIAIMPGNEGTGLSKRQKDITDSYIYIPQYGIGTASLNVSIATSIILHKYNKWLSQIAIKN